MMVKKDTKEEGKVNEIKLDKKAQQALAYLSGIPSTEEEILTEIFTVTEEENTQFKELLNIWLRLQEAEIKEIGRTLLEVIQRLNLNNKKIRERLESAEYLNLVRKSFRNWSAAESEEKRILIRNLLVNGAIRFTSPNSALSMFIDWLDKYSEEHFQVIRTINQALPEGLTRKEIWLSLHNSFPPEDSAEADMFKMLILDLTTGYVIRQPREKDFYGKFIRAKPVRSTVSEESLRTSLIFNDTKKYVLTELGKQFVLYTMKEISSEVEEVLSEP